MVAQPQLILGMQEIIVKGMLPVKSIGIDKSYQRTLVPAHVKFLVENFDPALLGIIVVSRRADGTVVTPDGQHRLAALTKLKIDMVECEIHENISSQREAKLFQGLNKNRLRTSAVDLYRADLAAGDETAQAIKDIVEDEGFFVILTNGTKHDRQPRGIFAIKALEDIFLRDKGELLRTVLRIIKGAWQDEGAALEAKTLLGLAAFHWKYKGQYEVQELVRKLKLVSIEKLVRDVYNFAKTVGGSAQKSFAYKLVDVYNSGKRQNRLAHDADLSGRTISRENLH